MSFSDTTLKQRKKEAKALKSFIIYGFILSLVLHTGIVAAVIFNLLSKKNQVKEKPTEITFVDILNQEEVKPESRLIKQDKPKLDSIEKPVKQDLKPNNNESNTLNKTKSINLDNIPIFKSTPQPQKIQQPSKTDNSNLKVSKPSPQPQTSKKQNNQSLPTPIPTEKTTSEFKPQPKPKSNTADNSQPIPKNNYQPKKARKIRRENNRLERQKRRAALKKARINRRNQRKLRNNKNQANVDTSLTKQSPTIQENNELKNKLPDIKDNQPNNPTPSEKPSPTNINRKKPTKKIRRRRKREINQNQTDSKVTENTTKNELESDSKQASSNSKVEEVLEKPANTRTSQNKPKSEIESNTTETNSNINSSENNSINETNTVDSNIKNPEDNPETNKIKTDSSITNSESVSKSPNPVTTSPLEDTKGNNNGNNDIDTNANTKKPNNNSKPSTTSNTPKVETNLSGSVKLSLDGKTACRKCNVVYPKWALKIKIQGRIVVAVDADEKGKIIPSSIRLVTSSGNEKLDNYHLKRVERWKLKRSKNGRTGVTIGYEYILE